ncbi:MAG: hypothetical protein WD825_03195 [Gemmatimonadaceae bacterium]
MPATLAVTTNLPASAIVGSPAGTLTVRVSDTSGGPVSGALVTFTVSLGAGRLSPTADTTKADGTAAAAFTIGTMPGQNEVTAVVSGLPSVRSGVVVGVAGASRTVTLGPRALRLSATQDSSFVSGIPRDEHGNSTGAQVTWASRDPALVTVTPGPGASALVRVASRPGQTYVVASAEDVGGAVGATDSVLVTVHDASSTPCSFLATPTALSAGESVAFIGTGVCLQTADASAEYALIAHYNTAIASISAFVSVVGTGISAPGELTAAPLVTPPTSNEPTHTLGHAFEFALRQRERREMTRHLPGARAWAAAASTAAAKSASVVAAARVGDLVGLNVNAFDFCSKPNVQTARVVAITSSAVVLADTSNPVGGFTDEEFRSFGVAMDTLVHPLATATFGSPSDIDGNGRVAVLFSKAVNELTPRGSGGGVVLGFFYGRDLIPKQSPFGSCPASNAGEMFYLLVPDPQSLAGDARSKTFVQSVVVGTIAHEYQHLINASRRMYVNAAPSVTEEVWLNEGLSHIAEELVFYRTSKLSPRQNIGASLLRTGSETRAMFDVYQRGNFGRYLQFLRTVDVSSPLATNDFIATRGAAWAFLRYLADRSALIGPTPAPLAQPDGDFWRRIVNSKLTGTPNLDAALDGAGLTTLSALRDWAIAVVADDNPPSPNSIGYQQPSWNFLSAMPEVGLGAVSLETSVLRNGIPEGLQVRAGATTYLRFAVPQNQEAFIQGLGSGGGPRPRAVHLTVLRIR